MFAFTKNQKLNKLLTATLNQYKQVEQEQDVQLKANTNPELVELIKSQFNVTLLGLALQFEQLRNQIPDFDTLKIDEFERKTDKPKLAEGTVLIAQDEYSMQSTIWLPNTWDTPNLANTDTNYRLYLRRALLHDMQRKRELEKLSLWNSYKLPPQSYISDRIYMFLRHKFSSTKSSSIYHAKVTEEDLTHLQLIASTLKVNIVTLKDLHGQ